MTIIFDRLSRDATPLDALFFSGGEPHINNIPELSGTVDIDARVRTWEDFGMLLALLSGLNSQPNILEVRLFLPYFPGARQDRNPNGTTPLTVSMYATSLAGAANNLLDLTVHVVDMHSNVGLDIINEYFFAKNFLPGEVLPRSFFDDDIGGLICPDDGAINRTEELARTLFGGIPVVRCHKVRDFGTGRINYYQMEDLDRSVKKWLVADDICDGGATFNILAEAFRSQATDAELQLYVTHGIFSKGLIELERNYSKIYTTDSFLTEDPELPAKLLVHNLTGFKKG